MSIENNNLPPGTPPPGPGGSGQPNKEGTFSQEFRHQPVSARVPERLTRGILSTGVLVLDGPNEFVLDFMQALTRPFAVAARVVLTPAVMEQFVVAVRDNIARYEQRFGVIPPLPKPPTDRRPTLQEIYDEFKLPEEQMSGNYANAVMVGHSASEFFFDFITNFYPTSAVSSRVFLSAPQMPRLLDAVTVAFGRFQQRIQQARQQGQNPNQPPQQPPPQNS
ncbi:MAG TPA: DUF3467 domain-containing protein [Tepidisphaeraceae bacterium]|jgi:hypothetical protein|nr:DUF3467 domain-containing protein [Tepidisphaeraceae bacterium]